MNIAQWLSDPKRTFADGVTLYNTVKRSTKFDNFFSAVADSKPGQLHYNYLLREMQKIHRIGRSTEKAVETKKSPIIGVFPVSEKKVIAKPKLERPLFYNPKRYNVNELSDDMKKLWEENQQLTKTISNLSEKIKVLGKGSENNTARKNLREEMLAAEKKRNDNWAVIDDFWNNGRNKPAAPAVDANSSVDTDQLFKDIEAAKQYIGHYRNSDKADQLAEVKVREKFLIDNGINWKPKTK